MQSDFCFSVLMSLYAKENPVSFRNAFKSIYHQQTTKPNQIVLVLDGPLTPELYAEIESFQQQLGSVLTRVELPINKGLAHALNTGLEYCRHEWVFRMDTDDLSLKTRFESQARFLKQHRDVDVLGALIQEFDPDDESYQVIRNVPEQHDDIVQFAKSRNPINHPVSCFRKAAVIDLGGYPPVYPEDYLLWVKMIQSGKKFHNQQTVLLKMRTGSDFIKRRGRGFLKGEINTYRHMLNSGFISLPEFVKTVVLRSAVRLAPASLKVLAYRHLR